MIDVSGLGGDFMPRRRPEDRFAQGGSPQGGGMGQQPFTPPQVPQAPPPGGGAQFGQQPFTPPQVPQAPPPGGEAQFSSGVRGAPSTFNAPPPSSISVPSGRRYDLSGETTMNMGMGQVGTGQQPFTPVAGQPPGVPPPQALPGGEAVQWSGQQPFDPFNLPPPGQPPGAGEISIAANPNAGGYAGPGQPGTSVQPGEGGFPYPEQWQQAGDIYGQLAGGMPGMPDPSARV